MNSFSLLRHFLFLVYLQVPLDPMVLLFHHLDAEVEEVVELGGHGHKVDGADVKAVEHVLALLPQGHAEPGLVMGEVAERKGKISLFLLRQQTVKFYLLLVLVIPCHGHVRDVGGDGLDLPHELIPDTASLLKQIF